MKFNSASEGEVVEHVETGAHGVVIRGGPRPRVQWYANMRIIRTDENMLRLIASDEIEYRKQKEIH